MLYRFNKQTLLLTHHFVPTWSSVSYQHRRICNVFGS